jgi:hypothetical protein
VWVQVSPFEFVPLDSGRLEPNLFAGLDGHRQEIQRRGVEVRGRGERPELLGFRDCPKGEFVDPRFGDENAAARASKPGLLVGDCR